TSEEISQDCIVMPIWKDSSYFDSPTQDVDNGEPKSAADDQKQDGDGLDNENDAKDKYDDDRSLFWKEIEVSAGNLKLNAVSFRLLGYLLLLGIILCCQFKLMLLGQI
ncbi:hypothetical protein Tco_0183039, partial [Tanacetum coccineum]